MITVVIHKYFSKIKVFSNFTMLNITLKSGLFTSTLFRGAENFMKKVSLSALQTGEDYFNRKTVKAKPAVLKFSIKLARILHFLVSVSEKIPPETNHSGGREFVLCQSANSLVERERSFSTSLKIRSIFFCSIRTTFPEAMS